MAELIVEDHSGISSSRPDTPNQYSFNFVTIIVGGEVFKTQKETLDRYPETLLGSSEREQFWVPTREAYVFTERCRRSFESILYFYQSGGILSQPKNIYGESFFDELHFFKIPLETLRIISGNSSSFNKRARENGTVWTYYFNPSEVKIAYPPRNFRYTRLYTTLFGGRNWFYKYVFSQLVMGCDLVATVLFVFCHIASTIEIPDRRGEEGSKQKLIPDLLMHGIEITCVIWIIIQYVSGLLVAEKRWKYMKSFMPLVDSVIVVAVMLDYTFKLVKLNIPQNLPLRAIGILRLFNLARHSTLLYCLGLALRQSFNDLIHVLFVIIFIIFLAAGFVYFIEGPKCGQYDPDTEICTYNTSLDCKFYTECLKNHTEFTNVFVSSYWAAVTITTVGYGDMVPVTWLGKVVGSILALIGLPLIAIPMPLIMTKFENLYTAVKEQKNTEANRSIRAAAKADEGRCMRNSRQSLRNLNSKLKVMYTRCRDTPPPQVEGSPSPTLLVLQPADGGAISPLLQPPGEVRKINGDSFDEEQWPESPSWGDRWKAVYGRCPTGTCNRQDCRTCGTCNRQDGRTCEITDPKTI